MCWNSVKTIEFSIIQREQNCCLHKSYMPRGLSSGVLPAKVYIVLEWAVSNELPK